MKIGIVSTRVGRNDGVGRVNYEIAMEALRAGHEITLFCEAVDRDLSGRPDVQLELMPAEWLPTRLLKDVLFAWRLNRRLSIKAIDEARNGRHSCDAILANGLVSWSAADVNAVHFVHSSWRCSPHHPWHRRRNAYTMYRRLYNDFGAMLDNVSYRRSKAIVAVSNRVRQELIDIGVPSAVITTIVNGVDASEFRPGPGERSRFGLPERARIGLFVGDLKDARKNLDTVLAALVRAPELHLAIAGNYENTPWPQLAAQLGVAPRVHFLGFQRDMPGLMRASDLVVFPSRYEPFGLVVLEALASGLPVVTARSTGGAEVMTSDVGFVLDDSEDVGALARALSLLASSDERRADMAIAARRLALQYSWRSMATKYLELLENAAGRTAIV